MRDAAKEDITIDVFSLNINFYVNDVTSWIIKFGEKNFIRTGNIEKTT